MAAARRGLILLTGAPDGEHLTWDERHLLSDFDGRSKRYLHPETPPTEVSLLPTPSGAHHAKWRSIPLDSLVYDDPAAPDDALRGAPHLVNGDTPDDDFLEHSIAILENLDSSQIISTNHPDNETSELQTTTFISFLSTNTSDTNTSFNATCTSPSANSPPTTTTTAIRLPGHITDLKRLPPAAEITRLLPQTITVNLLVALITLTPTRSVPLRRPRHNNKGTTSMDILELIVGDESRAGFRITFWLHPPPPAVNDSTTEDIREDEDAPLRKSLLRLRPGNILLLTNVALSSWRGNVYGQNLGRRFARGNATGLSVLSDVESPQVVSGGGRPSMTVVEKWRRVRDWSAEFVGGVRRVEEVGGDGGAKGRGKERVMLPPDTQD